jgi:glycerol-3-phosphate dehydrogenase (NAD(P)+)
MTISRIGVAGGGAWGTALAHIIATESDACLLWARDEVTVETINRDRENTRYLRGVPLAPNLRATTDLEELCQTDALLLVVPAQTIREFVGKIGDLVPRNVPVICCAKGLETNTGLLMSEIVGDALPNHVVGCLSGPTFASEVALGMPTAVTLAVPVQTSLGTTLATAISTSTFRPYLTDDVIGAEVGGAVKNILAIACGIATGIGMGENTRAALITRGIAEATRFAVALGGRQETLAGLAGLGDLAMSCASRQSRNFRFGEALGQGQSIETILNDMGGVVEGRYTARATMKRATQIEIDLPICHAVDMVLNQGADLRASVDGLMRRPLRAESDH